jgi:putative endonuclease
MYTVYVLQDNKGKFYKGYTNNLLRRLKEHRLGHTRTTSRMKALEVVYSEQCDTKEEAKKREKYFKTAAGRRFIKTRLY